MVPYAGVLVAIVIALLLCHKVIQAKTDPIIVTREVTPHTHVCVHMQRAPHHTAPHDTTNHATIGHTTPQPTTHTAPHYPALHRTALHSTSRNPLMCTWCVFVCTCMCADLQFKEFQNSYLSVYMCALGAEWLQVSTTEQHQTSHNTPGTPHNVTNRTTRHYPAHHTITPPHHPSHVHHTAPAPTHRTRTCLLYSSVTGTA